MGDEALRLPDDVEVASRIDRMLADGRSLAVFLVRIDGFQAIARSDPDGADRALVETATRLDRLVRSSDVLGCTGPGTFVLVGSGVQPSFAGALIERIQGAVALPVEIAGGPVSLRVDIGLAFAERGASGASLLELADADLQRSRRAM